MGTEDFINIVNNFKEINEKVVGEDSEMIKIDLAKDEKQAWVKHMVDQYLKKQPLDIPPEKYGITKKDVMEEILRMEIKKIFDSGR